MLGTVEFRAWKKYNKYSTLGKGNIYFFLFSCLSNISSQACCIHDKRVLHFPSWPFLPFPTPPHRKGRSEFDRLVIDIPGPVSFCGDPWWCRASQAFCAVCGWPAGFHHAALLLSGSGMCLPVPGIFLKVNLRRKSLQFRFGSSQEALLWPQH